MTKVVIEFKLNNCDKCPLVKTQRTHNASYAFDYYCGANGHQIKEYVECIQELPEVPNWCPNRKNT